MLKTRLLIPKLPKNYARCAKCGHPVNGPYCQGCTLLREKLEEDLVTYFQNFQNTFESSDDSTNVVNAPREPVVVKQDHGSFVNKIIHTFSSNQRHCFHCKDVIRDGETCQRCTCTRCGNGLSKGLCYICGNNQNSSNDSPSISVNSSQNPPHINKCCCECGEALDGILCQQCTCKSCGKGAHIGYNCPSKVSIISNPEPCIQTMNNELPQTLPGFDPTFYSDKENSAPCISKPNFVDESSNVFNPPPQPPIYSCEFCGSNAQYGHSSCQIIQKKQEEKWIEEEQAANAQYWKIPTCCDDDDDYNSAITPALSTEETNNSLSMGDEHLDTIPATKSDEVIKSSVEDLVPIPSESEDENVTS
nr:hypothetical protein [Tanacetum cinerariifolium]